MRDWIDDSFLEAAVSELGTWMSKVKSASYVITGKDAGLPQENPKMAAQIWFEGQKVKTLPRQKYAFSIEPNINLRPLASFSFMIDSKDGNLLQMHFMLMDGMISSFLLKSDADKFAESVNLSLDFKL